MGLSISVGFAQVTTDSALSTARAQAVAAGPALDALNADIAKVANCAKTGKFYTTSGCQPPDVTNLPTNPPKFAGIVVGVSGASKTKSWYGACTGSRLTCHFSCSGKAAWVEVIKGVVQPYYCPPLSDATAGGICSDADAIRAGRGSNRGVVISTKCREATPSIIPSNGITYMKDPVR